jgi:methyl-accepting chemotaxis protein
MIKRLFSMRITPAYMQATLMGGIPILLLGIAVAIYIGHTNGSLDAINSQVAAAHAIGGHVPKGAVTARSDLNNIVPPWVIFDFLLIVISGAFTGATLGKGAMKATFQLLADARSAAGGDLRVDPQPWFGNEYGMLQASFGRMLGSFRQTIARIDQASVDLKGAAGEMAHTSDEAGHAIGEVAQAISSISEGAAHQVDLIVRSSTFVAGIEGKIRDTAEHAREAQRQSADTEKLSEEGVMLAAEVQDAMQAVRESSLNTASVVRSLGEKSSDIDLIVQAITDIAQQTNMLALNASIEAARAGEQGKGFANVAQEVRVLAEDAQASAEEIASLVKEIQMQTAQAVGAMEDGVVRVEEGFETVNRNRQTFHDISTAVRALHHKSAEINELADGIADGTGRVRAQIEEVASVAEESSASTEEVSASTEETSAAAEEVTASAQRVAQTAANLAELSGRFILPEGDSAIKAAAA